MRLRHRGAASTSIANRHADQASTAAIATATATATATVVHRAARNRHAGTGFIATVPGIPRTALMHLKTASPRGGLPDSPRTYRLDPAGCNAVDHPASRAAASTTRKKAPAHKAAGANGTTTT
nr:hypothetical protein [Burkholderia ambifaria]